MWKMSNSSAETSDSDGDWIPLPTPAEFVLPSNPNSTPVLIFSSSPNSKLNPLTTIQRKLSDKGWPLIDSAEEGNMKPKPNQKTKANEDTTGPLPDLSVLSLIQSESKAYAGARGDTRRILADAMSTSQVHDDKMKELEAGVKSLNFRMDAMQSNINEMREQFRELEVLLANLGLVREGLK